MWSVKFEVWSAKSAVCSVRCGVSREGHGRDRVSLNYRSFMFGKLPPPACPGLCCNIYYIYIYIARHKHTYGHIIHLHHFIIYHCSFSQHFISFHHSINTHTRQEWILVPRSQTQEWLCFQWARHRNDPGSRWFQRARRRNGSRTYIVASKLRTPAPMDSKAGTFSVPDTRLFVGHSLVTGRVAPCLSSFWFQRARHKNGPGFIWVPRSQTQEWLCFQWARHRNDPGSRWFQRARRRNGSRIKFLKLG